MIYKTIAPDLAKSLYILIARPTIERSKYDKEWTIQITRRNSIKPVDDYEREEMANISDIEKREKELMMEIDDLKQKLDLEKKQLIQTYEKKMQTLHAELLLRMKVEIHEIEERKN